MKVLVLAGGEGERLWPLSRSDFPKQFIELINGTSLLKSTIVRLLKKFNPEDIYILTNSSICHLVRTQLDELDFRLKENILLEPEKKNTAPALVLAMKFFEEKLENKDEVFLVCPSDSYISNEDIFLQLLDQAKTLASCEKIVVFGVAPYRVKTGYGYIKVGKAFEVEEFIEKPCTDDAEKFINDGGYLWNCGIFLFTQQTFFKELKEHAQNIYRITNESYEELALNFSCFPSISFDDAVVKKSKKLSVIPIDLVWGDLGSWDGVYDLHQKDEYGNVSIGEVVCFDSRNSLFYGTSRSIVATSIKDLLVIDTPDVLFIGSRDQEERVKLSLSELKLQGKDKLFKSSRAYRPWGYYDVLNSTRGYKVKKIHVFPFSKLSLQYHFHRDEHWTVVCGRARITKGEYTKELNLGESILIRKNEIHRIANDWEEPLEIIEVQLGEKTVEEDIVRLSDEYGRLEETVEDI